MLLKTKLENYKNKKQKNQFFPKDHKLHTLILQKIVDEKALVKILDRYKDHYDEVMKYNNIITIFNLNRLSFLRVGLEKEVLRFMEPYMDDDELS